MTGMLPARQLKYILAWADIHQEELLGNWERARQGKKLAHIDPLT